MKESVEIYGLVDPRSGVVRYIGKARDSQRRLKSHIRDSRRRDTPVYRWFRKLQSLGMVPALKVLEAVAIEDWPARERYYISNQGIGSLLNVAPGGDEPFCSKQTRAANGRRNARAIHDNPVRRRMWELKRAMGQALKSGHVREDTKQKLREGAARHPDSLGEYASV